MDPPRDSYGMSILRSYPRADGQQYQTCPPNTTNFISDDVVPRATYSHASHLPSTNDNHSQYPNNLPSHNMESSSFISENETIWARGYGSPGRYQSNVDSDVAESMKLFPFVCGLCYAKFNSIVEYYFHFTKHSDCMDTYFHCCEKDYSSYRETGQPMFTCSKCKFVSPTLCLLHEHLDKVEHLTWYRINVLTRRVYHLDHTNTDGHSEEACESETSDFIPEVDNGSFDDKKDINTEGGTDSNVRLNIAQNRSALIGTQECPIAEAVSKESHQHVNSEIQASPEPELEVTQIIGNNVISEIKNEQCNVEKTDRAATHGQKQTHTKIRKRTLHRPKKKCLSHTGENSSGASKSEEPKVRKTLKRRMMKDVKGIPVYANNTFLPCDKCGAIVQRSKISVHMICHRETRDFPCDKCDYRGKSSFSLKQHVRMVHPLENNFTCQTCGKSFKNNLYLKQHTNTHSERDKQCQVCPQTFTTQALLRRHMFIHTDEKLYKCQQCDRKFTFKGNLNSHVRTVHSDQRDFTCTQCGKTFKIMHALKKHMKTHEPHQYFCSVCDKSFVTAFNMKIHMKVHDINPFNTN